MKELEEALLDGRAHLAVHSAKDMPGDLPAGLGVLAVLPREDPRDVVVGPPGGSTGCPPARGWRPAARAARPRSWRPGPTW